MSDPKPTQHRITLHGRNLHFVGYEGIPANVRRGEAARPPMWYLMSEGKRHPVMEQMLGQPLEALDQALRTWAEANAFGAVAPRQVVAQLRRHTATLQQRDWWGA
jgi:hypothetical protein